MSDETAPRIWLRGEMAGLGPTPDSFLADVSGTPVRLPVADAVAPVGGAA